MSQELVSIQPHAVQTTPLTVQDLVARAQRIESVVRAVMKEGTHFGVIPGTQKPTLYLPGAEKLLLTFKLAPAEPKIENLSTADECRYRVQITIIDVETGAQVGIGMGECSSSEVKYKWRKALCQEEFDETPVDRRREAWARGKDKPYKIQQIRTEIADLANTVLKMAKKRALVDGTKTATGTSDIFEQDLEDMPESLLAASRQASAPKPTVGTPKPKTAAAPARRVDPPKKREVPSEPDWVKGDPSDPGPQTAPTQGVIEGEIVEDHESPTSPVDDGMPYFHLEDWEAVRNKWHDRGVISKAQEGRLFAIAKKAGWTDERVRAEVAKGMNVEVDEIPWGDPYNMIVALFEQPTENWSNVDGE